MSKFVTLHGFGSGGSTDTGSLSLNFEVVGGTSEPVGAKENTIWINTNTPINGWEFISTVDQSVIKDDGFVSIIFGSYNKNGDGGLNTLTSTDGIYIKPMSAMQVVNGVWENKPIKIYQNGWVEVTSVPSFTYDGDYEIIEEDDENWKIRFLTSGNLRFTSLADTPIDVFLVGGGGTGGTGTYGGGGGGGGGLITTGQTVINAANEYTIIVGGSAGNTSAFALSASAGGSGSSGGSYSEYGASGGVGGQGTGSGGNGGRCSGGNGISGSDGIYEFSEEGSAQYGGGGGGGGSFHSSYCGFGGTGGAGGGGTGAAGGSTIAATPGTPNTGGGGGGGASSATTGGEGGSGIVIIRNKRG